MNQVSDYKNSGAIGIGDLQAKRNLRRERFFLNELPDKAEVIYVCPRWLRNKEMTSVFPE